MIWLWFKLVFSLKKNWPYGIIFLKKIRIQNDDIKV